MTMLPPMTDRARIGVWKRKTGMRRKKVVRTTTRRRRRRKGGGLLRADEALEMMYWLCLCTLSRRCLSICANWPSNQMTIGMAVGLAVVGIVTRTLPQGLSVFLLLPTLRQSREQKVRLVAVACGEVFSKYL